MRGLAAPIIKLVVFAITTIVATVILGIAVSNYQPTGGNSYKAIFTDATSLNVGDEVRIAGVRIGEVTSINVYDKDLAEVGFQVRKNIELPADVQAAIRYRHLAGQRYMLLSQPEGADPQRAAGTLADGGTIPLENTSDAVNLTVLFNGFRPLFTTLKPEDVNQLIDQIILIFEGESNTITQLVANVGTLTNAIADKDEVIGQVVNNLNLVLEAVNEHDGEVREMITSLDTLVSGLAAERGTIGSAVQSLSVLTSEMTALLEPGRPAIQGSVAALGQLSQNLNDNEATVVRAIQNLPRKADKIGQIASYGSFFNFYLCGIDIVLGPGRPSGLNLPMGLPSINQPIYTNASKRCQPGGITR